MGRTTRQKLSEPRETPATGQPRYEPQPGWRPLLEHLLAEGVQRYGQPLARDYEVDNTDSWFYKSGLQKQSAISNGEAFNLVRLMCATGNQDEIVCGIFPTDKYDEIAAFWQNAARDFSAAVVAGDIRVWARNGGIAGQFRPVAVDTWKKAIANIIDTDGSYGPHDQSSWLASCIYWDKLLGVSQPELCSFFSNRIRQREEIVTEEEIDTNIRAWAEQVGKRLTARALAKCAKKYADKCEEEGRKVTMTRIKEREARLYGGRTPGRPRKQEK